MNLVATNLILGGIFMPLAMYLHFVEITAELTPTLNSSSESIQGVLDISLENLGWAKLTVF